MSENEIQKPASSGLNRRAVVTGAAWSVPVIAAAIAAPAASASVANASVTWTGTRSALLGLQIIDFGGIASTQVDFTLPNEFTLQNGPGAISGPATVTIVVDRPETLVDVTAGPARGFGVASYDGVPTLPATRTAVYQQSFFGAHGFPLTTYSAVHTFTVASNGALVVPVVFGLIGRQILSVTVLATFTVTLIVDFGGGISYTATTIISVPAGAGVL